MASPKRKGTRLRRRTAIGEGKVRKAFWLDPATLAEAQGILGTATARETVEAALELVGFVHALRIASCALEGLSLARIE